MADDAAARAEFRRANSFSRARRSLASFSFLLLLLSIPPCSIVAVFVRARCFPRWMDGLLVRWGGWIEMKGSVRTELAILALLIHSQFIFICRQDLTLFSEQVANPARTCC